MSEAGHQELATRDEILELAAEQCDAVEADAISIITRLGRVDPMQAGRAGAANICAMHIRSLKGQIVADITETMGRAR